MVAYFIIEGREFKGICEYDLGIGKLTIGSTLKDKRNTNLYNKLQDEQNEAVHDFNI